MATDSTLPERVIQAFGGLTKMAEAMGWPISTIDSWRANGSIPHWRIEAIRTKASEKNLALPDDFPKSEGKAA